MRYLMGIDDTDNLESRGTGHRVRMLADWLSENKLVLPQSITRHQLLVDPRIPYTSHNSSACLVLDTETPDETWEAARGFLLRECAPGSDAGLTLAGWDTVNAGVLEFARQAKINVLTMSQAEEAAQHSDMRCEGLTGTHGGIIGAVAAIGLHRAGHDGRFLWLPGLRELQGKLQVREICARGHIDRVCTLKHEELDPDMLVDLGDWVRPILRDGRATIYTEERDHEWHIITKEHIKKLSN